MTTKEKLTAEKAEATEAKLMPLLTNEPSDLIDIQGVKLRFQRPSMQDKYKFQAWTSRKLKDIEVDPQDEATQQISFYFTYFGILNGNVVELITPKGEKYEIDPKKDYKFLFEQYVGEEVYTRTNNEEAFVLEAVNKFIDWQNDTEVSEDDLKNS